MGTSRISYPEPASALSAENRTKDIIIFLSQPSPKSNPNSNLGLAGQHNWS